MSQRIRLLPAVLLTIWFASLAAITVEAATITRGPYLQMGTPNSVVVRWRTDVATDSRVAYGTATGQLTSSADDAQVTAEHVVTLSGLSAQNVYYYSVGTSTATLAGNDANHFFLTAPAPGTPKATRIWVLGDSGTANSNAQAVRDAYTAFTSSRHTDLWLMLGDNAYSSGTDSEYQAAVFNMYPAMLRKSVLWPTLGNHDGSSADSASQSGPYYNMFTLPRNGEAGGVPSGTEAYYSFDYGNIHFIVLDSFDSDRSPGGAMLSWMWTDLQTTTRDWIIAFWHHPPYSRGSHNSDTESALQEMRENALPLLEQAGVDLVLSGHSHSYERSFLLDGHYGTSNTLQSSMILNSGDGRPTGDGAYEKPSVGRAAHAGAVYTVAGSSGKTSGGTLNHPVMYISLNVLGSLVLDVQGNQLDATFLDSTGSVRDTFSIVKGGGTNNAPVAEDDSAVTLEDTPVSISVLSNDTDLDGHTLTVASVTQPSNGLVTINAGSTVTYSPTVNFHGSNSFTYTASDGHGGASTATVSVTVNPVPDPPVANNQSVTTGLNTSVAITLTASDAEGNPLTYSVVTEPGQGSRTGIAPNLTYTPNPNFSGSDSFTFQADDDGGVPSNVATVSITVAPPTPSPIATEGFESKNFSGGTGWSAPWTVSGNVTIRTNSDGPHGGSSHVRLRERTGYLQRSVNLSGATNVRLTFWGKVKSFESSDKALVKVSPDGVTFTTVKTFTSAESNNTYRYYDLSLAGFSMTSNFRIAFDAEMSSSGDYWFLDDIQIIGIK